MVIKCEMDDMSIFNINGYDRISQGKSCGNKGGLAIYIDNRFDYEIIMNLNMYKQWEGLVIKVKGDTLTNPFIICNVYRPPRSTIPVLREFLNELTPVMNSLDMPNHNVILAGDFNINLLKVNENIVYGEFLDLLMSLSLNPQITLPTRFSTNSGTLIDNIFTKLFNPSVSTCAGIHINRLSDHQPCFLFIDIHITRRSSPKFIQIHNLTPHSLLSACNDLKEIDICAKLDKSPTADVDQNYNIMYQEIHTVMNKYTTMRTVKFAKHKHKKTNWITYGVLKSIKYRDKLYKTLRKTPHGTESHATLTINLRTYNTILRRVIRAAKSAYYECAFNRHRFNIKNTWGVINEIITKSAKTKSFPDIFKDGQHDLNDDREIANRFNAFFTNVGPDQSRNIHYNGNKTHQTYLTQNYDIELNFTEVNDDIILNIINKLPNKNSCGFDNLSTKIIKALKDSLIKPLTLIINQILNTGVFPSQLKIAKVIPIFKKDDNKMFNNYRPISLLPVLSKVVEKVISSQINDFFKTNNLFYDSQYGFRPGHSTEYAAIEITDRIISAMDKNKIPLNIYLDLSKAFDTLDHAILLDKLFHYGIRGNPLKLISSYLENRQQYVEFRNTK